MRIFLSILLYAASAAAMSSVKGTGLSSILEPVSFPLSHGVESSAPEPTYIKVSSEPVAQQIAEEPPATFLLTQTELEPILSELVSDKLGIESGKLSITFRREWQPVRLLEANWDVAVEDLPADGVDDYMLLSFELTEGSKSAGQWRIPVRCELWREVLMAKRRLSRGAALLATDFEVKPANVLKMRQPPAPVELEFEKYELAQTVGANSVLLWRDIVVQPAVRKGQVIEVVASEGAMVISMQGMALEDGVVGDIITVRNLTSKKSVQAEVVDDERVKVYF